MASPALEPVTLEGSFVRLEPMTIEHHAGLTAIGLDPDIWRRAIAPITTPEEMRSYMETALQLKREGTALPFVTVERSSGRVVALSESMSTSNLSSSQKHWRLASRAWRSRPRSVSR